MVQTPSCLDEGLLWSEQSINALGQGSHEFNRKRISLTTMQLVAAQCSRKKTIWGQKKQGTLSGLNLRDIKSFGPVFYLLFTSVSLTTKTIVLMIICI